MIEILCFGITRDITGSAAISLEVNPGILVSDLRVLLTRRYPELEKISSLLIAVNSDYADDSLLLNAGDEIALIPPVSGG